MGKKVKKRRHRTVDARHEGAGSESVSRSAEGTLTVDVPVIKRFGAYAVDWALGGIVTGAPAVLLYAAVTRRTDFYSDLYVFEALGYLMWWGMLTGVLCILAGLFYYVYVPAKVLPGQTLGKRLFGLEIRRLDGSLPTLGNLFVRYGLVGFLAEGSAFVAGRFVRELVTLIVRIDVATPWSIACLAITTVSALFALYRPKHRALHDAIAGTHVLMSKN